MKIENQGSVGSCVSILVVVDGTLRPDHRTDNMATKAAVSILVVVDGTLRPAFPVIFRRLALLVSILVVVDGTLRLLAAASAGAGTGGFNPCCCGWNSEARRLADLESDT